MAADEHTSPAAPAIDHPRLILERLRAVPGNPVSRARRMVEMEVPVSQRGPGWDRHWRELEAYIGTPANWTGVKIDIDPDDVDIESSDLAEVNHSSLPDAEEPAAAAAASPDAADGAASRDRPCRAVVPRPVVEHCTPRSSRTRRFAAT
jgi:hypothetical protein